MLQWAELATLIMLGLATFCVGAGLFYLRMAGGLVVRLATDCVHLKLLLGHAAEQMQRQGWAELVSEQMSDAQKAKMN